MQLGVASPDSPGPVETGRRPSPGEGRLALQRRTTRVYRYRCGEVHTYLPNVDGYSCSNC